jgi:hypothetical protein
MDKALSMRSIMDTSRKNLRGEFRLRNFGFVYSPASDGVLYREGMNISKTARAGLVRARDTIDSQIIVIYTSMHKLNCFNSHVSCAIV